MPMLKKVDKAAQEGNTSAGAIVYRGEKDGNTVVGYWLDGLFVVLSRHASRTAALNRINALNGGTGTAFGGASTAP